MTAAEALPDAVRRLRAAGVEAAAGDARRLLAHAMNLPPDRLTLHLGDVLEAEALARFEDALTARQARQPVAQIVGVRQFYGRSFRVTPDVLDPRPETETLITAALAEPFDRVLDLGTGSGAILLTLLAECAGAQGIGADVSPPALAVAQNNARRLGVASRAGFVLSDWFGAVTGRFKLIVANPPYISADEFAALDPEVRQWEPQVALTPGGDGLGAYRAIAAAAPAHLDTGGRLLVEIGPSQANAVGALLRSAGLADLHVLTDLDGRDRVLSARRG